MKTKVKITGTKEAQASAIKFLRSAINGDDILKDIGQTATDQIRSRTRGRLEDYRQADLKQSSIENRDRLIRAGNAFDKGIVRTKRTSNLSMSGQLLDAIKYRILKTTGEVVLFIERARSPYKGIKKPLLENTKDNLEIKKDLESKGRRFLFLSDRLQILLQNKTAQYLRRQLSIYNKLIRK